MQYDLEPGDFVINPLEKGWGMGQVQSIIKNKLKKIIMRIESFKKVNVL